MFSVSNIRNICNVLFSVFLCSLMYCCEVCNFCILTEIDQEHLLTCKYLVGKNKIVTCLPDYKDLFLKDIDEQVYTSRIKKCSVV